MASFSCDSLGLRAMLAAKVIGVASRPGVGNCVAFDVPRSAGEYKVRAPRIPGDATERSLCPARLSWCVERFLTI